MDSNHLSTSVTRGAARGGTAGGEGYGLGVRVVTDAAAAGNLTDEFETLVYQAIVD
jgi:hypothetical protein